MKKVDGNGEQAKLKKDQSIFEKLLSYYHSNHLDYESDVKSLVFKAIYYYYPVILTGGNLI